MKKLKKVVFILFKVKQELAKQNLLKNCFIFVGKILESLLGVVLLLWQLQFMIMLILKQPIVFLKYLLTWMMIMKMKNKFNVV